MKVLIVISTILSIALCELVHGGYNYEHNAVDEKDIVHDTGYNAGAYQNYVRMVSPQILQDELPPVYIRHVPKPTKDVFVPIIHVSPPLGAFKRQGKNIQGISAQPQREVVGNELPASAQIRGRTLFYDRSPSHIEVKIQEVPSTIRDKIPAPKAIQHQYWFKSIQHFPSPLRFVQHVQPKIVHHQTVEPQIVHYQPAQEQQAKPQIVYHQPAPQHAWQIVQQRGQIAQDVKLVNGFTPEVAKATAEHLAHVAAIRAVLPNID